MLSLGCHFLAARCPGERWNIDFQVCVPNRVVAGFPPSRLVVRRSNGVMEQWNDGVTVLALVPHSLQDARPCVPQRAKRQHAAALQKLSPICIASRVWRDRLDGVSPPILLMHRALGKATLCGAGLLLLSI